MQKIPKQEYTTEFKERVVKHVKEGKSIGLSAKELGLVEQTGCEYTKPKGMHWRIYHRLLVEHDALTNVLLSRLAQ
jgi:hypothetical protein